MCGISGHYQFTQKSEINEDSLYRSIGKLTKRGPDSQTIKKWPGMGMAHSRLSIIDLETSANQPMTDISGRYSVTFNGEILNFRQLKNELNYDFQTNSDTEVLLAAYIKWGESFLKRLKGFFSFVIYDSSDHSILAARDQYGIKPFLYSFKGEDFFFASELKALLEFPVAKEVSIPAINSLLQLSYIPFDQTILSEVKKLNPGSFLKIKNGKVSINQYYNLEPTINSNLDFNEAKSHLSKLLDNSLDNWLISDAPVGAFLSGGTDSSIVVALASQKVSNLKTYSITYPESPFHDESKFSRLVAKKYSTQHSEIPLTTSDLFQQVDSVLEYLDEPFADSSAIPTHALCKQVGKHVRVSLSGDGADEVFGGYEKHRAEFLTQKNIHLLKLLSPLLLPVFNRLPQSRDFPISNYIRKANRFLTGSNMSDIDRYITWCSVNSEDTKKNILNKNYYLDCSDFYKEHLNNAFDGIRRTLYQDCKMVLPSDMLTKVDMMSMANSLEVRPVFLDPSIVDFTFSLPDEFKIYRGQKKILLTETFGHLLPKAIYDRPKHGFTVELLPFFRGPFWEKINDYYLNENLIREQGIFNQNAISQLKKDILSNTKKDLQPLIWGLITFQNFWIKYAK